MNREWREVVESMTRELGLGGPDAIDRLPGGRNNRVYRVETASRTLLLKHYYRAPDDPRDRLAADFGFSRYAWAQGIRCVPEPLIADPLLGLALYAYVDGRAAEARDVNRGAVDAALDFVEAVNRKAADPAGRLLPFASEACFSLADHLDLIGSRVERLRGIPANDDEAAAAKQWVESELAPRWVEARDRATDAEAWQGASRCLSPSDFGFHNAIVTEDGHVVFHDFEHAGWDDPAKLVCDFFSQVALPVPPAWRREWIERYAAGLPSGDRLARRVEVLLPLLRLKWCCIVLEDFLPAGGRRRQFAGADDLADRRPRQRELARRMLRAAV